MKLNKLFIIAVILGFQINAFAVEDDTTEDWMSYDNIISELSVNNSTKAALPASGDPFDHILIHTGVGLATTYVFLSPESGPRVYGFMRGFEVNFGIDLFSRNWMAEGSLRSFGTEELRKNTEASLKEFDLKVVYNDSLSKKLAYRFATGMAARYMDFKYIGAQGPEAKSYSTPSAILSTGLRAKISKAVSLGTDVGYRWALVDDTIDESAIDAGLRLDAHF